MVSFYREHIFPRLVDVLLDLRGIRDLRLQVLTGLTGRVLEIGFGTGLNLPHYPTTVRELHILDPNPGMLKLAQYRLQATPLAVTQHGLGGEVLPFNDGDFDACVSTFTLCSIGPVAQALAEIRRVLKAGGEFVFLEHGLAPGRWCSRLQRCLTPIQKRLFDGCHLDRPISSLIDASGLQVITVENFYYPWAPKVLGYFYKGVAVKVT